MIQLNRMDEDRTFSLNITFRMKRNINEEHVPQSKAKLLSAFDIPTIKSLIKKVLKRNDMQVFIYSAKVLTIHEYKILERVNHRYQMIEYRITLKAETVINYGGVR